MSSITIVCNLGDGSSLSPPRLPFIVCWIVCSERRYCENLKDSHPIACVHVNVAGATDEVARESGNSETAEASLTIAAGASFLATSVDHAGVVAVVVVAEASSAHATAVQVGSEFAAPPVFDSATESAAAAAFAVLPFELAHSRAARADGIDASASDANAALETARVRL